MGGRAIRTRSQAIIDDTLLIDFPCDTYKHFLDNRLDLTNVQWCFVTYSHSDHLYATDFACLNPGFSHVQDGYHLSVYGSDKVGEKLSSAMGGLEKNGIASFTEMKAFDSVTVGRYTVTALPAIHDVNAGPLFYMISDGEKTVLYGHDTHYFHEDVWAYFKEKSVHFDMVSLDCTNACLPLTYVGHMGLAENVQVRTRMLDEGYADENTRFVCNHYSHNGISVVYDDFVPVAGKEGFLVSYDGMIMEI
jgi:phosphoribosyl 1,2-cyclic phosphate phosphodiesterase